MLEKMKAPGDKRPTWRNGVIQIHITRACDLSCTSCTQGSNLSGKPVIMTLENFETSVQSLSDYFGVIGIFGGNPTLHPRFPEICEILSKYIPFEQRGLWSNSLNGHGAIARKTFNPAVSNINIHTSLDALEEFNVDWPECHTIGEKDSRHSPPFVALKDMEDMTDDERWNLITSCDINQLWSAMICQFRGMPRAFFCELAGAQSMLHEKDYNYPDTGIFPHPNWWKRPIGDFKQQIEKHCFECGIPLRGAGDLAVSGTNEYVSKTHHAIYNLKKPGGKTLHIISKRAELIETVGRATDYIANGAKMTEAEIKILIGVPTAEYARRADFYDYFNQLDKPVGSGVVFVHGQSPARARNLIIQTALDNNFSHILFLDDDVAFKSDILMRLLAHDKELVTGLYLMRNFPHQPIIFDEAHHDGRCFFHYLSDNESGLVPIVAAGLGCCLIKTSAIRKIKPVTDYTGKSMWVTLGELEKDHWCDDISFFLRAREANVEMYCDLDVKVGHMASVTLWPEKMPDGNWSTIYDTHGTGTASVLQLTMKDILDKRTEIQNELVSSK